MDTNTSQRTTFKLTTKMRTTTTVREGTGSSRSTSEATVISSSSAAIKSFTILRKCCDAFSTISVEPVLFLYNAASMMVWVTSQDLMEQKACKVNLGYSTELCDNLSNDEDAEATVQTIVSDLLMWRSILETSIKIVTVPLLGWWGDKKGRKAPMIFALICLGCESLSHLINTLESSWPVEAMLTGSLFYGLSGGTYGLLMLAYSFLASRTTTRRRTLRMGILEGFYYLGSPAGLAVAPLILGWWGYTGVFGTAIVIYAMAVIYVVLAIRGQQSAQRKSPTFSFDCSDWGFDKLSDAFYTAFKRRPSKTRRYIFILFLAMFLDVFVTYGEYNVKYLFSQRSLDWNYDQYSHYGTASSFFVVVGSLVVVPLLAMWPLHDTLIGFIGALSRCLERTAYACATSPSKSSLMYVGAVIGTGSSLSPTAIRSELSKLAYEDVGQIYSVMAVGESLIPFASAPVYKNMYEGTVDGYVGAFYLLSACVSGLMGFCFLYTYFSIMKQEKKNIADTRSGKA